MTGLIDALERAGGDPEFGQLVTAAAERIAELEAQNADLRAALEPFAKAASRYDASYSATVELWQNGARIDFITVGDLRLARAARNACL